MCETQNRKDGTQFWLKSVDRIGMNGQPFGSFIQDSVDRLSNGRPPNSTTQVHLSHRSNTRKGSFDRFRPGTLGWQRNVWTVDRNRFCRSTDFGQVIRVCLDKHIRSTDLGPRSTDT